ncbi:MAG: carbohydrate porin [Hyphomicrobiales bacterium]|nr:carbohydrate porin [Hyphomicrobiales bacterium]
MPLAKRPLFASTAGILVASGARRHAALGLASTVAIACVACAAHADEIPPLSPALGGFFSDPFQQTPASAASLSDLSLPQLAGSQFRADASSSSSAAKAPGPWGALSGDWQNQNFLGDIGGLRPALSNYGVTLTILENVETFGNLSGGVKQGWEADGLTTVTLQMDTEKAFGLKGGTLNVSGLQYWGGNLSADNLLVLQTLTDIEAPVGVRLWELWYQQKFGDKFDIKVGEQSLDEEFTIAPTANSFFISSMSGWPGVPTIDLPGGGPAYPLAGLGVRGRVQVTDSVTVLAGVFNGSPIPRDSPNVAESNPHGVSFPLDTGTLAIAELQYAYGSSASGKPNSDGPLPGVYKIGAWYDSYKFDDQQYDTIGLPLASPLSNGDPAEHHGDFSLYGVMDQMIWRSKDNANRSLNVFVRPMFTPYQDRNLVSASINAGFALHAPLPGRDNDIVGVEMGTVWASSGASGFDRQMQFYQPSVYTPIRSSETFIEASYQFQVVPSWVIQPDVQYFINPGMGIANPDDPMQRIKNELVVGLRTNINF